MEKRFVIPVLFMTAVMGRVWPRKEHLQGPLGAYMVQNKFWTHLEVYFTSAGTAIVVNKLITSCQVHDTYFLGHDIFSSSP
jgi:hypothetical protein